MLLAIDIGNTNITMGVFRGEILMGNFRMTTQIPRTSDEFGVLIRELLRSSGFEPKDIENVIIASVVPDIMYSFTSGIKKYFCAEPIVVGPGVKTGVKIGAENPRSRRGSDRRCGGSQRYLRRPGHRHRLRFSDDLRAGSGRRHAGCRCYCTGNPDERGCLKPEYSQDSGH